jgi:hypothetical protein
MPTPDELRADIAAARADFQSALEGASASWEKAPAPGAEGEDAWSPRQAAEHAIGADLYFASEVCGACGYPGLELSRLSLATPAEAITAFAEASAKSDGRLKYAADNDLSMQHKRIGRAADDTELSPRPPRAHAAQIRAAG